MPAYAEYEVEMTVRVKVPGTADDPAGAGAKAIETVFATQPDGHAITVTDIHIRKV